MISPSEKECQYCMSLIPSEAKKCRFCMEWQEEDELNVKKNQVEKSSYDPINYQKIITSIHSKIISKLPFNDFVNIFILVIFFFLYFQAIWLYHDEEKIYLVSIGLFSVQMLIVWYGLIWLFNLIGSHQTSFIEVSTNESVNKINFPYHFRRIFNNKNAILVGILFGAAASIGDFYVGTPFKTETAKMSFAIFEFINMTLAGAGIYSILVFSVFIKRLKLKKNNQGVTLASNEHIFKIGKLHLRTSIIAIVPFAIGLIAKLVGDWEWNLLIYIWYGVFAIIIIIYLFLPLTHIHDLMLTDKENHINQLNSRIQELIVDINKVPSNRNFSRLFQLQELEKTINKQSTWPFDFKSISAAFIAVILPIALMILDKIFK